MKHSKFDLKTPLLRSLSALAAGMALATVAAAPVHAAAYTYSTRQRTINAGILVPDNANSGNLDILNGQTFGDDPNPYVFYILNKRNDIKPFGWNIVNPLAPKIVTGALMQRWNAQTSGSTSYTLNESITPNMAAYWEVSLSKTNLTNLEQYNILLIDLQGHTVSFTDNEVTELRQYVDNGGQLWIEDSGGGAISPNNPLFLDMTFFNGSSGTVSPSQAILPSTDGLELHQPIIGSPFLLLPQDANNLGNQPTHQQIIVSAVAAKAGNDTTAPDAGFLSPALAQPLYHDLPLIAAGQFGAGQIVVDAVGSAALINNSITGIPVTIGGTTFPNAGPYCGNAFANAPADDLKFVSDIISWASSHPQQLKTSHQSSASPATLGPALTSTWTYPVAPSTTPQIAPGAAINGSFVYVRDNIGVLHCFNATPGTDIIGTGYPDAGMPDYSLGFPYDQVWNTTGVSNSSFSGIIPVTFQDQFGSGPAVATPPDGKPTVFIEDSTGKVYAIDATTGVANADYASASGVLGGGGGGGVYGQTPVTTSAPAPTYYDGRLYAGQPNNTIFVYDFRTKKAATYAYTATTTAYVTQSPTVGLVRETLFSSFSDDLVVGVTTNVGLFTLHGGAFHDFLQLAPPPGGLNYSAPSANNGTQYSIDPTVPYATYSDLNGYQNFVTPAGVAGDTFTFASPPPTPLFADYNVDWANSAAGSLTRDQFAPAPTTVPGIMSAPALDANGNFYYTTLNVIAGNTDSTIVCVHDGRSFSETNPGRFSAVQMEWRFRLPYAGESDGVDASGVSYAPLAGFQFFGAPVVDAAGDVYALATNSQTQQTAVLCFNGTGAVTLHLPINLNQGSVRVSTLAQPVPGTNADEFGNTPSPTISGSGSEYNGFVDGNGNMQVQNFSQLVNNVQVPNLSEPQPVEASYILNNVGAPTTVPATFYTNLTWYTILPTAAIGTGSLTLTGDYLFFADMNGNIYHLYAYPQNEGLVNGLTRIVQLVNPGPPQTPINNSQGQPLFGVITSNVGSVEGPLSTGHGILIANGVAGIAAYGAQFDIVADSTRVMEVDGQGDPTWVVDGTSETNPSTGLATHIALNHPRDVTQVTSNDYLVADTGNNRCVRFDRSGNVIWELTRFNDLPLTSNGTSTGTAIPFFSSAAGVDAVKLAPLLAPGEPLTLNHPTSVSSYVQVVKNSSGVVQGTLVHYLIADTGNYRIIEVVDAFDANGAPVGPPHDLVWVSHTYDALGRKYAYASANYFNGPNNLEYIAALVKNVRIAPLSLVQGLEQMQSATADAPGSSIILLDYDPADANPASQKNGFLSHAISAFLGYFNANGTFNLAQAPSLAIVGGTPTQEPATTPPTLVYLRNPRFLQTYTPPGGAGTIQNFLLADDNGVFDLHLDQFGTLSGAPPPVPPATSPYANYFEAQWGFTQADYQGLGIYTANPPPSVSPRFGIPFIPNSIQRISTETDTVGTGASAMGYDYGDYILTNGYTSGSVTPFAGFGGEVLELNVPNNPSGNFATKLVNSFGQLAGNRAAPLSQPTFAGREK